MHVFMINTGVIIPCKSFSSHFWPLLWVLRPLVINLFLCTTVPSNVTARKKLISGPKIHNPSCELTFDFLALFPRDELSNLHHIAHKRISTRMMYSTFDSRFKLNDINCEACSLRKKAKFIIDWLDYRPVDCAYTIVTER